IAERGIDAAEQAAIGLAVAELERDQLAARIAALDPHIGEYRARAVVVGVGEHLREERGVVDHAWWWWWRCEERGAAVGVGGAERWRRHELRDRGWQRVREVVADRGSFRDRMGEQ